MLMHLGLMIALILRGVRRISIKYIDKNECENPHTELLQAEGFVFAATSTAALLR